MDDGLTCRVLVDDLAVTVVLDGPLSSASSTQLDGTLRKHLLDRGRVLVDVSAMRVEWAPAAAVFSTALAAAGGWPLARMVLVGAVPEVVELLRSTGKTSGVHLAPDRVRALALLDERPRRIRRTVELSASSAAPALARVQVRAACEDWGLTAVRGPAEAVANELVTNAVVHSTGECLLVLSQDRRGLTVSVRDDSAQVPDPADVDDPDVRRLGLRVVQELSARWGVTRHRSGKTVWALLRVPPPAP